MNVILGCQNALSSASRLHAFRQKANKLTMPVLTLLALLCGMVASAHAQSTAYYAGITTSVSTGYLTDAEGMATDAAGNLYVAGTNGTTATVYEIARTGVDTYSTATPVALPTPALGYCASATAPCLRGIAFDSNGNLWVAAFNGGAAGQVYELTPTAGSFASSVPTAVGTGWVSPWGITADKSGDVFVTDENANTVTEITGGVLGTPITLVAAPRGIAVDSSGNLFVVNGNNSQVQELVAPGYTAVNTASSGISGAGDDAFDTSGNLWVSAYGNNSATELSGWDTVTNTFGVVNNWGSGLGGPVAVWPSIDGTMIVSDTGTPSGDGAINQINFQQPLNFASTALGASSATQTLTFAFTASTTIGAPLVVSQGAAGKDFVNAGTGTCVAGTYAANATCTVAVTFSPRTPGSRAGAVELVDGSNAMLAEASLSGLATGPEVVFSPNLGNTSFAALASPGVPQKIVADGSNNIFVVDSNLGKIFEIPAGGGTPPRQIATTYSGTPYGLAIDGAGNLFVGNTNADTVSEILAPAYSTIIGLPHVFAGSTAGLAVDASGNLYVAESPGGGSAAVEEATAVSGYSQIITFTSSLTNPFGIAVDSNGNVFVADNKAGGGITEFSAGVATGPFGSFTNPTDVAVDAAGNLYVTDTTGVTELTKASSYATTITLFATANLPAGVALDNSGNVYYSTNASDNAVYEIQLASPAALSFGATNPYQTQSAAQTATISNIGNADLTFSNAVGAPTDFKVGTSASDCYATVSVITANSCTLSVTFTPQSVGTLVSGTATLTDNAIPSPQVVNLSGTGIQAAATVVAASATTAYSATAQNVTLTATVTAPGVADINEGTVAFTVVGTTGGTVTSPTVVNGAASVTYVVPAGQAVNSYTISAVYTDASGNFTTSTDATHTLTIGLATQSALTVNVTTPATYNTTQTLTTTGGNGTGAVTYSAAGSTACSVTGAVLTITSGTGTCSIIATKAADANYSAISSAATPVTVQTATQATLAVVATSPAAYLSTQTLTTTGGNGTGAVTFSAGASTACSVTGTTLTITSGTGTCLLTATKAADNNYSTVTSGTTTVTVQMINQAALVVHATSPATYNTTQTLTTTGGSGTGAVTFSAAGSTACSVTGAVLTITSGTGTCSITATKAADANYNAVTSTATTVTVQTATQATLAVVASSPAAYNSTQTLTTTGGSGTGAVTFSAAGSTACSVTGATLTITSGTGTCSVTATKAADANYSAITSLATTVTVQTATQATLAVVATSPAVYNSTQTLSTTGGSGTGAVTFSAAGSTACSVTGTTLTITAGSGTCSVIATKAADTNYSVATSAAATVTVTGATLNIAVNSTSRAYGAANPTFTGTVTGFLNGDGSSVTVTYSTTATVTSPVGTYPITATISGAKASNYTPSVTAGTLTVTKAGLTIVVNSATRVYNTANPNFSGTITGLLNGDNVTPSYTTTATLTSPVGTYPITATISGPAAGNYNPTVTPGTLTITQATTSVSWTAPAAIIYGTPLSATQLDATASVAGNFTYTPAAGTILPVGAGQTLSVSFTPTDSTDYKSSTATTIITVTSTGLTVSANNATRVYGTANPAFTGTVTGAQNGDTFTESFTTSATTTSNVGTYPIVPSAVGTNLADYTVVIHNGTLTITQANSITTISASGSAVNPGSSVTLTATVASATSGTPTGTVTFYDGTTVLGTGTLAGGVATYSTTSLAAGASNSLTGVYGGDINFTGSSSTATSITVGVLDFSLGTPTPATQTGAAGTAFTYSFSISPTYGTYAGTVNFTATGLPSGAVANFSPSTIPASGGPQTVTMIVNTLGGSAALVRPATPGRGLVPVALAFLLLPLAGTKRMRREGRRFGRMACLLLLVLAGLGATAAITGCGSSAGANTTAQSYTITITATSGAIQHTSTVTLDLQ